MKLGIQAVTPHKVILFGSRARSDARGTSDFDIAFLFDIGNNKEWIRFVTDVGENGPTLYRIDLVNLNEASQSLKQRIEKEGVVLYEQ